MKKTSQALLDWFGLKVGDRILLKEYEYDVIEDSDGLYLYNGSRYFSLLDILDEEYTIIRKPKLSDAERVILENLDAQFKWLAKDRSGTLYAYSTEPTRQTSVFNSIGKMSDLKFPHLFQFIHWKDEPYNIQDLLNER